MFETMSLRAALTVQTILLCLGRFALGLGVPCPEVTDRVFYADTVVLGRTIKEEHVQTRPEMFAVLYEFRIDDVLKGELYKRGETIAYRFDPALHRGLDGMPLLSIDEGSHFAFVSRKNGETWISCPAKTDEISTARLRRIIAITEDPLSFLDSENEEDIDVVLSCIGRRYCQFNERRRRQNGEPKLATDERARIVAYVAKHAASSDMDFAERSVGSLAYLEPTPPEAFEVFVQALGSQDPGLFMSGAKGLANLGDSRAIPLLIERLERHREEMEALQRRTLEGAKVETTPRIPRHVGRFGDMRNPEFELLGALYKFGDPRVTDVAMREMETNPEWAATDKLAKLGDPRAIDLLLRKTWEGDGSALQALCRSSDPRIVEQARERTYDQGFAPYLLACQGDVETKAFMHRLIRQGHVAGATWAGRTRDPETKADLISGLARASAVGGSGHFFQQEAAHALGRLHAFDLIPTRLNAPNTIDEFSVSAMLLYGLADRSIHETSNCLPEEQWDCIAKSLNGVAEKEHWSGKERDLADNLLRLMKRGPEAIEYHDLYHPWSPPAELADMPDPLDEDATRDYLKRNLSKVQRVLRTGSLQDQHNLLQAANHCKAPVLDGELALHLLTGPDRMVRSRAHNAVAADRPSLTAAEVERWAFSGDGDAASTALHYIRRRPKPEYAPITVRLLREGRHLFNTNLFEAIIETKAVGAADLLRAYLTNEHLSLRVNAAVTLVHLDDPVGRSALPELLQKTRGGGDLPKSQYVTQAREKIGMPEAATIPAPP